MDSAEEGWNQQNKVHQMKKIYVWIKKGGGKFPWELGENEFSPYHIISMTTQQFWSLLTI